MIERKTLKKKAKANLKHHYFRNVILVFMVSVLLGGYTYSTKSILTNPTDSLTITLTQTKEKKTNAEIIDELLHKSQTTSSNQEKPKYTRGVLATFVNEITASDSLILGVLSAFNAFLFSGQISVLIVILIATFISFLFYLLVQNVISVGKNRYFIEQRRYYDTKIDRLLFPYKVKKGMHVAMILFVKYFYQLLWSLTIIGGFIKHYSYLMIPYILAENPTVTKKEAFTLSKQMMKGYKWQTFLLDFSLLGWKILDVLTFHISSIFYYDIYKETLFAELYMQLRNEKGKELEYGYVLNDHGLEAWQATDTSYPNEQYPLHFSKRRKWLTMDYQKDYTFLTYILFFFTISMAGWVWEVFLHLLNDGIFVNRGTLIGPWLPIYGTGGILILWLLKSAREKPWLAFLLTMLICGIVEYTTGWYLETFKHLKWWDYSGYFLNLHGRICLEGLLVFGLGGCAFVYIAAPLLDNLYHKLSHSVKVILCIVLVVTLVCDFAYSSIHPNTGKGITAQITETT